MTSLLAEAANTSADTSGRSTIVISVVLILVMIGVVGYLAWKNRKAHKDEK